MNKMKIIAISFILFIGVAACKKTTSYSYIAGNFGSVAFINASPTDSLPAINIYIDTILQTPTAAIAYKGSTIGTTSSGYITVNAGVRNIMIKGDGNLYSNVVYASLPTEQIDLAKAFTYIVYDTMAKPNRSLKILKLTDDLSGLKSRVTKVRFLNLAVKSTPVDVTFLRTNVTPNDSVTISNISYVGSSPNASTLSPFSTELPIGKYTIKLKTTNTQSVLNTSTLDVSTLSVGAFYTVYCTGTAGKQAISLGNMRH